MMTGIFSIDLCIYLIAAVFGMCIFSFLNVVIYRVPRNISYAKGFSMCPTCGHRLYPKDLVPVFSWLFLRGKCRYCGTKISPRYMQKNYIDYAMSVIISRALPDVRDGLKPVQRRVLYDMQSTLSWTAMISSVSLM